MAKKEQASWTLGCGGGNTTFYERAVCDGCRQKRESVFIFKSPCARTCVCCVYCPWHCPRTRYLSGLARGFLRRAWKVWKLLAPPKLHIVLSVNNNLPAPSFLSLLSVTLTKWRQLTEIRSLLRLKELWAEKKVFPPHWPNVFREAHQRQRSFSYDVWFIWSCWKFVLQWFLCLLTKISSF